MAISRPTGQWLPCRSRIAGRCAFGSWLPTRSGSSPTYRAGYSLAHVASISRSRCGPASVRSHGAPVGRSPQGVARILGPIAIWIADVRGTEARPLATLPGARIHGWLPDASALLVTWRTVGKLETSLGLLDVETGEVALRATAPRLLSGRLSPDGEWVAYVAAFTGDLQRDGLWVQRVQWR